MTRVDGLLVVLGLLWATLFGVLMHQRISQWAPQEAKGSPLSVETEGWGTDRAP